MSRRKIIWVIYRRRDKYVTGDADINGTVYNRSQKDIGAIFTKGYFIWIICRRGFQSEFRY